MTVLLIAAGLAFASTPTNLTVAASPNPSDFGRAVVLTATVSLTAASGKVTFYDGATVLGTGRLNGGQATLTTTLLTTGRRAIRAYYGGNVDYASSSSTQVTTVVNAVGADTFRPPLSIAPGAYSAVVGDFNGDGKTDLAAATSTGTSTWISVLLGNGDGSTRPMLWLRARIAPDAPYPVQRGPARL